MDRAGSSVTVKSIQRCPGHGGVDHLAPDQDGAAGFDIHSGRQGVALAALVALQWGHLGVRASTGDSVMVPEGALLDFENPGPARTYILSVLSRDDGFSKQLQASIPTPIDAEDLQVLRNL